ncbi:MAG: hypothetical protein O6700_04225, partial [Gammaproteobacteria bacterium]|nr:hypothetical protein [Gammaproteobacteria bacterium]
MSFLGDIKRRKVFQVAAVYVVVAWLLIQVVDVVGAPLNLPSWIDAVVIVLLAVGFPIAVILAWAFDLTPQGVKPDSGDQASGVPVQVGGQRLNHLLQALVLVAVGFLVVDQYVLEPSTSTVPTIAATLSTPAVDAFTRAVRRYDINLGPTEFLPSSLLSTEIAISPDARRLVYRAEVEDSSQLYLRELDQVTAQAIPGTEGGSKPFFSPDGESIGFIRNNRLHRVSVRGGPVQTLTDDDVQWRTGAFWTTDDTILFTVNADIGPDRLHRIPAVGGAAEPLGGEPDGSVQRNGWPYVLPDGNRVLFTIHFENLSASDGRVAVLSLETGEAQVIIEHAYNARYAKTGHIVFMRSAALWAVPFDLESLETTGDAVPIVSGIQTDTGRGASVYAFSDDGLLVYLSGVDTFGSARNMHLVWVSRDGEEEPVDATPGTYLSPRISPDGRRLAYTLVDSNGSEDIWVYDLARSVPTRLTFDAAADIRPTWTPDGQRIVYWSDREDPGFFIRTADGTGQPERLTAA